MKKTIKKTIALVIAAAVMTAMAACSSKENGSNAPQLISGGTAATVESKAANANDPTAPAATGDAYSLTYKGAVITPGMEAEAAIKALGD